MLETHDQAETETSWGPGPTPGGGPTSSVYALPSRSWPPRRSWDVSEHRPPGRGLKELTHGGQGLTGLTDSAHSVCALQA